MYISRHNISNLYESMYKDDLNILEEGIDEKIPKLLGLLPDKVRMDDKVHDLKDDQSKGSFIRYIATQFDPSRNAAYITWILRMVKTGQLRGI